MPEFAQLWQTMIDNSAQQSDDTMDPEPAADRPTNA
jgi:hypothetical protein